VEANLPRTISLPKLLQLAELAVRGPVPEVPVTGLTGDSRKIQPGNVFVAWVGGTQDGHRFIDNALENGAVAVVGTRNLAGLEVPYIRVKNSQIALARLAAAFYDFPGRKLTVIGVTGTDGKTTTANLIHSVLMHNELKSGMISTLGAVIGNEMIDTGFHVTTPDAPDVQRYLAQMVEAGMTHVVLETTSHGLDQHRVDSAEFDIAVVTNITQEHLDYHHSYENYRAAKGRLFSLLSKTASKPQGNPRLAILNREDDSYTYLAELAGENQLSYGLSADAELRAQNIENRPNGLHFVVAGAGFRLSVNTQLVGLYNVYNCLAAFAVGANGLGLDLEAVRDGIAEFPGAPGRMERIDMGQPFTALVDFAHTPNALRNVLATARELTDGKVIVVFGSAGLRDRMKRSVMAEISAELADLSVLTAEDPRTESLDAILQEMAAGLERKGGVEGESYLVVPDRGEALRVAVSRANPGDLVIACGKGHEQSMCFGEIEYPWDDRTALRAALAGLLDVAGPAMPYLPTQENGIQV
jgi:UDP-N-acetylmuramoyl-L-alanyl-D-glutamate--2,6-diaminopimelate ligase